MKTWNKSSNRSDDSITKYNKQNTIKRAQEVNGTKRYFGPFVFRWDILKNMQESVKMCTKKRERGRERERGIYVAIE